jgi:hypothetical protein
LFSSPFSAPVSRQRVCWTAVPGVVFAWLISLLLLTAATADFVTARDTEPTAGHVTWDGATGTGLEAGEGPYVLTTRKRERRNRYILEGWRGARRALWSASSILGADVYDTRGADGVFRRTRGIGLDCEAASVAVAKIKQTPVCGDRSDCVIRSR